jgi:hypothetical protein
MDTTIPELTLEQAARRKTRANTEVRRLIKLLCEAEREFASASRAFAQVKAESRS